MDCSKTVTKIRTPIKILLGGSPCTKWSIAQKNGREVLPEGIGWELFENYRIAKEKFQPDFFLYENNKSAAQPIKDAIYYALGGGKDSSVRLTHINSALVSAQNRQRFYVTNFGDLEQPEDRGIYLDDILRPDDFKDYNGGQFIRTKENLKSHYNGSWQIGRTGKSGGQAVRVYDLKGKSVTLKSQAGSGGAKTGLYLTENGVKSLSVSGAEKLQTMPSGYTKAVPPEIGISALGNGWTAEVIIHILQGALKDIPKDEEIVVLSMYDGIATGRYCLDKMGFTNVKYYAYEIDPYAQKIAMSNYPDIVQCGDAFRVREDQWKIPI